MLKHILIAATLFCSQAVAQQSPYNPAIDVLHYAFHVRVNDNNDTITGKAVITVRFTKSAANIEFDLMNVNDTGRGMVVTAMRENQTTLPFLHQHDKIDAKLARPATTGQVRTFEIDYKGAPADGLIISKNKFGHRTLFADNWPNRARNWIPCKDHLSDKATVEFFVEAPAHYKVVANGLKIEERDLAGQFHLTHWKEDAPLPTKVMVVGIADFAVDEAGKVDGIPVSSWVFPEQKEKGFYDYGQAVDILPYFIKNVGPYAYRKLANVQSKTIFGGMENAGAIFYYEGSISGTRKSESLLAHEIAHQWFGDAATEADWPHIWLSEGFATQMTHMYLESKYGRDTLVKSMKVDRKQVIEFTKKKKVPVVDTSAGTDIMQLLNTNSYQKGGWVLHMLRSQLGDSVFWRSVRGYYAAFRNSNAHTSDLQRFFEWESGKKLSTFFNQWLYMPENPTFKLEWSYDAQQHKVMAHLQQQTKTVFVFPLTIKVWDANGNASVHRIDVSQQNATFRMDAAGKPSRIELDPDCVLLFEGTVTEK